MFAKNLASVCIDTVYFFRCLTRNIWQTFPQTFGKSGCVDWQFSCIFFFLFTGASQPSAVTDNFNLQQCQEELRDYYLDTMGKVYLLPWTPEETKEMESIFVDLELVGNETSKSPQNFERNDDLVTLKNKKGQRLNRILVTGDQGSGKSTTAANIAYKWALQDLQGPLSKFSLVFMISMHEIQDSDARLVDVIFENVLPEDSKVSREGLKAYITEHARNILFLIDGMDEDSAGTLKNDSGEMAKLLHNSILRQCCVILTCRSHKVGDLGKHLIHYTQVKLKGFSLENIFIYIAKFFQDDKGKVNGLFSKIQEEQHILYMASIPVLLLMICLLWDDQCSLPNTLTQLYQKTVNFLWKRYKTKIGDSLSSDEDSDDEGFRAELKEVLNRLGEVALQGELQENQVIFKEKDFGREVCNLGCQVGIITKEHTRSGLRRKKFVKFLHSSFQCFCAAVHLTDLIGTNSASLDNFYGKLFWFDESAFNCLSTILRFCCGIQPKLTTYFLQYHIEKQKVLGYFTPNRPTSTGLVEIGVHLMNIFESQLSSEQCMALVPVFSSTDNNMGLTVHYNSIPSIMYTVKLCHFFPRLARLFSTIKQLTSETRFNGPWLSAVLQYTTNLETCVICLNNLPTLGKQYLDSVYKALSALANLKMLDIRNQIPNLRFDITKLVQLLTEKNVKLTDLKLVNFHFDVKVMAKYLSCTSASISSLMLLGNLNVRGQLTTINGVIAILPNLKKLNRLQLSMFQISSTIKNLKQIVSQLQELSLDNCGLHERYMKELFSFLDRAQKLKNLALNGNTLSVTSAAALVECLNKLPLLEILDLQNTGLKDESACILAKSLTDKSSLQTVALDGNPDIGPTGKDALKGLPLKHWVQSGSEGRFVDVNMM